MNKWIKFFYGSLFPSSFLSYKLKKEQQILLIEEFNLMSPRYEADPSKVSGVITVLDKGEYEVLVGEPKAFEQEKKLAGVSTGEKSYGVRYSVTVMEGSEKGAKLFFNCYQHTDGARQFSKPFQIAAAGFSVDRSGEKKFDEKYRGKDWSFNTDNGGTGDAWRDIVGKRLIITVDVGIAPDGITQQQQWKKFRPLVPVGVL